MSENLQRRVQLSYAAPGPKFDQGYDERKEQNRPGYEIRGSGSRFPDAEGFNARTDARHPRLSFVTCIDTSKSYSFDIHVLIKIYYDTLDRIGFNYLQRSSTDGKEIRQ
ncbi:hypothetical protein L915_19417 [Phytophthora nicotianae]|uniref:Uncharacterized protein n=1 Tax=Phytophthora nicotianae TaxID=4792 RepID=W2HYV5_PHYNI|nr:hypothetical protein L915_19417 [Phytophthora nicotianae]ETL27119.1 hypothetical protein L916_19314 [Phytophthora nicotianae]